MKVKKLILPFLFFLLLTAASAQNIEVGGLQAENVNVTVTDNSNLNFATSYMNQTLSPREVYVPEKLDPLLSSFDWYYDSWNSDEAVSGYNIEYSQSYSGNNYYSRGWDNISDEARRVLASDNNLATELPKNQFISSNSTYTTQLDDTVGTVFGNKIADSDKPDIYWDIEVKSHVEHLIIDYRLVYKTSNRSLIDYNVTDYNESKKYPVTLFSDQDVYSGNETDVMPLSDAQVQAFTDKEGFKQKSTVEIDNKFDTENYTAQAVIAVHKNHTFQKFNSSILTGKVGKINQSIYSEKIKPELQQNNLPQSLKLDDPQNYKFLMYNISVPPDSRKKISSTIQTNSSLTVAGHNTYILGSIGGTTTYTSTAGGSGLTGNFNKYKEISVTDISDPSTTISKAQPFILNCGNDQTTGTGDILVDCTNIDNVNDIAITDEAENILDYHVTEFNLDTGGDAAVWVYNSWSRDDTIQAQVLYGDSQDGINYEDISGTWQSEPNLDFAVHFNNNPLTAEDYSPNSYGTTVNGPNYISNGVIDGGASFDGGNDKIDTNYLGPTGSNDRAAIMWTKSSSNGINSGPNHGWLHYGETGGAIGERWSFRVNDDSTQRIEVAGGAVVGDTDIDDANWHQIGYSFSGSSLSGTELYADGQDDGASDDSQNVNTGNTYDVTIGVRDDGQSGNEDFYDGDMDAIRMYSSTLLPRFYTAEYEAAPQGNQIFFSQGEGQPTSTVPQINDINTTDFNWSIGTSQDLSVNVTDSGNDVSYVDYRVFDPQGNEDYSGNLTNSATNIWNTSNAFTVDERGEWELRIYAKDSEGSFNESSTVQNVNPPKVNLTYPLDENVLNRPVSFNFTPKCYPSGGCTSADLYVNESGTWQVVNSSTSISNNTVNTIKYNFTGVETPTYYEWNVEVTDVSGRSNESSTNATFTFSPIMIYAENIVQNVAVDDTSESNFTGIERNVVNVGVEDRFSRNISLSRSVSQLLIVDTKVGDSWNPLVQQVQNVNIDTRVNDTLTRVQNIVQGVRVDTVQSENYSLTRNIVQENALFQSVDSTVTLFREEQETPILSTRVSDSWNPFISAQIDNVVSTSFDVDLGIVENIVQQVTVDEEQLETTGPREENTTIYGESLGAANYSTTVEVTVDDPEGDNIDTISIDGVTVDFPDNRSTRTANITLGDVKEFNGSIRATDVTGTTRDIPLSFKITDNQYIQQTTNVNLSSQDLNKTDTITNLDSGKDFYFVITHSALGQTATSNATHRGRVMPDTTSQPFTTNFFGDFLLEDTNQWVQNDDKISTDEKQYIRRTLNIDSLTGDEWENVATPTVQPQVGFSPCEICSRNPVSFSGDFENTKFYTDSGDIIKTQLTGTIGDFVIGERDTYFEQYLYTQQEDNLALSNIYVTETINDSEIGYGSFLNVEVDNNYGDNLLEVEPTISCTTNTPTFSTGTFDNQEWRACSQDLNGNTAPETFKVVIPTINQQDYNEEIRIGGFTGEPPEDDIDPFPGLQTDCREGRTENDLICVRDQWRTEAQATRQLSIANAEAGQVGESVGIVAGLLILLFFIGLWRRDEDENNR